MNISIDIFFTIRMHISVIDYAVLCIVLIVNENTNGPIGAPFIIGLTLISAWTNNHIH